MNDSYKKIVGDKKMVSFISIELISSFLLKFDIDYYLLSYDVQAIVVVLFQLAMMFFYFVLFYFLYKILNRIF